ncbi:MAG TPA: folylpolyglutamate synthase/dihydrofolate synthase family protein [Clostridia bacterium]|nr:folylpolyglutamate synthase/dihydrofolate synthase family protein [Clostridia bacterium]
MKIQEALNFLNQSYKLGRKLGLDNIKRLLLELGSPEKKMKVIHLAGTNGKGSTSAMIYHVILEGGYKVGFFSSPHLVHYNERFQYNGKTISDTELAKSIEKVKFACERLLAQGYDHPTEFEILTAVGFVFFADKGLDYAVIEVGLGGRLDATNSVEEPLVSVITPIAMDHESYLGDNLLAIAGEKAGIIKPQIPLVSGLQQKEVLDLLKDKARKKGSPFYPSDPSQLEIIRSDLLENIFRYKGREYKLKLLGRHQIDNAILALETLYLLREKGQIDLEEEQIRRGLLETRWPGRLEKISQKPDIFIDGGHNAHGVRAVAQNLLLDEKNRRLLLLGMRLDKDYKEVLSLLLPLFREVVLTEPLGDQVVLVEDLQKEAALRGVMAEGDRDYKKALSLVLAKANEEDQIFVMGSFYLIGQVKEEVLRRIGVEK